MITLVVQNIITGDEKKYDISSIEDINKVEEDFGPHILWVTYDITDPRIAAEHIARYLSNHHLNAYIIDEDDNLDDTEAHDPHLPHLKRQEKVEAPQKAIDLKDILEGDNNVVNIDFSDDELLEQEKEIAKWRQKRREQYMNNIIKKNEK